MAENAKKRLVLVNDDGWIMGGCEPPLTPQDFKEKMVATYEGTPADTLFWSVGGTEIYHYETEVGDIFGEGFSDFDSPYSQNTQANISGLMKDHGGPLTALSQVCHQAGMELFPSLRMNQHYETDPSSPGASRMRRDHPEWLIGFPGEQLTPGSIEWGIRTGLNFAVPQVRSYLESIICELFERFDVDGVELDFLRHPGYFRIDEGYSSRYLITDMLRRVRDRINAVKWQKNRPVDLAVRVPETLAAAERIGLDVAQWMEQGLVDMVVVGGGFVPFGMNIEQFVEGARGSGCRVYGCIEAMRPAADDEVIAAIASRIWNSGADGVYLYNYYGRSPQWKRRILNQIAAPQTLARLDKRYEIDHADRVMSPGQISGAFRHGHPPIQLPATLDQTHSDLGLSLRLLVADDLESTNREGVIARCTLRLRLERFAADDRLKVLLNHEELFWESGVVTHEDWGVTTHGASETPAVRTKWKRAPWYFEDIAEPATVVEFPLGCAPLRQGENELQVALLRQDTSKIEPVVVRDVELEVRFGKS
jgi:hypothetical protein